MSKDIRYFLNEPIEIKGLGEAKAFSLIDYQKNNDLLNLLHIQTAHYSQENIDYKEKDRREWVRKNIKNWDIICSMPEKFIDLINLVQVCFNVKKENITISQYKDQFTLFSNSISAVSKKEVDVLLMNLGKNVAVKFNDYILCRDNYDFIRNFIIKMNCLRFPKVADNKKLQEQFDKSHKNKEKLSKEDLEDTLSVISIHCGWKPWELKDLTMYQVNVLNSRIGKFKNHDAQVRYLCAGADPNDVKLEPYYAHLDLSLDDEISISSETFAETFNFINK